MKKSIAVICLFSLLFCSACNASKNKEKIAVADAGYTCDALIEYGEKISLKAIVDAVGGGIFSLTVSEPANIAGLTFLFNNSDLKITYNGMEYEKKIPLEYGGFAEILNEIFLEFITSTPTISGENGEYLYEGKNPGYSFKAYFNEQGFPLKITVDNKSLKANFSNWKY